MEVDDSVQLSTHKNAGEGVNNGTQSINAYSANSWILKTSLCIEGVSDFCRQSIWS